MSKKQKTNKRLDKLFQDIQPEKNDSGKKSKPPVKKEAVIPPPHNTTVKPASKPEILPPASTKLPVAKQASKIVLPEIVAPTPDTNGGSIYATNFQVGETDWATLRLIDETDNRAWTTDEQLLIKQVTDQLSLALENARLFQETQRRAQELTVVNQVVSSVSASLDLKSTLQTIADNLAQLLNAGHVGITLMNEEKTMLVLTADASVNFERSNDIGLAIPIKGSPATEEVIRSRKPLFIKDVENNPLTANIKDILKQRGTKNLLILPLLAEDEVIGTIGVDFYEQDRIVTQEEIGIIETIVFQTATAIQKSGLFERIEQSEQNLRALFSAMEDVVLVINREGRYEQIAPTNP
ncbi:MAG TPA: GAF domain-containing protein, partial [Anaerolineales bacterium]|nr:GAF domain-containing protein [Anaerolineales bacterium]